MKHEDTGGADHGFNESSNKSDGSTRLNTTDERNNISNGLHSGSLEFSGQQVPEGDGSNLRDPDARAKEAVRPRVNVAEVTHGSVTEITGGRIPPPEMMAKYERTLPGSAERFFALVEKEQEAEIRQKDELIAAESLKAKAWANMTDAEAEGRRIKNKEVETKRGQSNWEFIFSIVLRAGGFITCVIVLFLPDFSSNLKIAALIVLAGIIIFSLDVAQIMAKSIRSIVSFFQK